MKPGVSRQFESVTFAGADVKVLVTRAPIESVIESMELDAVVSSDDASLSMSGGVAGAIRELGGEALVAEARKFTGLQVGDVRVTSGGRLPVRYVLHAVTADWSRHTPILPTERTVRHLAREIFVRCEALEIRRIAIPALAAGAAGFPASQSTRLIAESLLQHMINISVLERVVFTIPAADAFRAFVSTFRIIADNLGLNLPAEAPPAAFEDSLGGTLTSPPPASRPTAAGRPAAALPAPRPGLARAARVRTDTPTAPAAAPAGTVAAARHGEHDCRPLIGERYVLLEEVGRGGLGVVYLAWDLVLRQVMAIKKLRDDVAAMDALKQEAALAMRLTHEGIIRVYHFEHRRDQGGPYLIMEYSSWATGEKWIADAGAGGLPIGAVLEVGMQICQALDYAHAHGVLHLDIKPGNIFVDPAAERTKLADFGIARAMAESGARTLPVVFAGTPNYMAPEQHARGKRLSPATDIYQLAASLWDLLTGRPPTGAREDEETRETELGKTLRALRPALAAEPVARPGNARSFANVLEGALASL